MKYFAVTVGVFDCLHEGHINLFKKMKELGKEIVVLVHSDVSTFENKGRFPVQKLSHRCDNLYACEYVDTVLCVTRKDPTSMLAQVFSKIEDETLNRSEDYVFVRGDDWSDFPGRKIVEDKGVEIVLIPYTKGVSTSQIREDLRHE